MKKLRQKEIRETVNGYEINPENANHIKAEQMRSKAINAFFTNLSDRTYSSDFKSKKYNLYTFALIDNPNATLEDEFKNEEEWGNEIKEIAHSIRIDADNTIRLKMPKMEKGKKFLYFISMEG